MKLTIYMLKLSWVVNREYPTSINDYRITSNLTDTRKIIILSVSAIIRTHLLVAVAPSGELEHTYMHANNDTADIQ